MSEWKKVKLGDVCQIIDGDRGKNYPKNHEFFGSGYCLFLNTGNVTKEGFSFANNQFITKEKDEVLRKGKIQRGDLILTTRGTVGNIAYYTNHIKYENVRINSGMVILRVNKENVDASFLYQLVRSKESRTYINSFCTGSAQPQLPIKNLSQICFEIPSLSTQHRIATILSRYDSLIENYQKQIKLLEEAAQRLYKEWFVDFHFPGYENAMIVDGVPEGWEKKKVGDMISKIQRTKQVTTNNYQASGKIPVIDQSRNYIAGYTDDAECLVRVTVPYIVFGDHTRILKYIPFSFAKGADGTQLIMSNDLERMPQTLFYNSLIEIDLSNYSYARHFKYLKEEFVLLPSEYIARKYDSIVSRYYQSIQKSREQIRLLTEARDRLLPKLMSGEITV
ncbi:MAG: restriction endonuclease subunit S [Candidatus Onthomorpha sp.]|nr:restriction endonuclease subunit S [Bacteroidales bacterium]MDY5825429.1 restriction endonuclease subunit S [Candidatus Onthomorpha sp.]